jgi:carboxypeptidase family protein
MGIVTRSRNHLAWRNSRTAARLIMRVSAWTLGALVFAGVSPARALVAQVRGSTLTVGVAEVSSGAPIAGAEIVLPELRLIARTDSLGHAIIAGVLPGTHRVRVRRLGFAPSDVQLRFERDTTDAVFRLERLAQTLARVDVSAESMPAGLKDFESRRKQGFGRFLIEKDLERDYDRPFMDVASVRFPGLALSSDETGHQHLVSVRSNCGATPPSHDPRGNGKIIQRPRASADSSGGFDDGGGSGGTLMGSCNPLKKPCFIQVYLDDISLGEADDGMIRTWDLSGAEYYTGASMPARYRTSGSACGVLLLWSKWR